MFRLPIGGSRPVNVPRRLKGAWFGKDFGDRALWVKDYKNNRLGASTRHDRRNDKPEYRRSAPWGPPDAAQHRRSLSPEVLRDVADEVKSSFVRAIGKPQLVLIEIDPYRLHAFWTVSREAMELARQQLGDGGATASMVLRVFEDERHDDMDRCRKRPRSTWTSAACRSRSYVDIFGEARRYRAGSGPAGRPTTGS